MTTEQTDLFNSNTGLAARIAWKYPIAGEDREFVAQEALIGLQKAVLAYDPAKGSFEPFARKVIKNHLLTACRITQRRRLELLTLDETPEEFPDAETKKDAILDREPTPAREAERNEIRSALQDGLASLTSTQKSVLEQYAKGVSFAEMARETGASEQAVRQMFQRGVNQMRPNLETRGVTGIRFMPSSKNPDHSRHILPPLDARLEKTPQNTNFPRLALICLWALLAAILIWLAWISGFFR